MYTYKQLEVCVCVCVYKQNDLLWKMRGLKESFHSSNEIDWLIDWEGGTLLFTRESKVAATALLEAGMPAFYMVFVRCS